MNRPHLTALPTLPEAPLQAAFAPLVADARDTLCAGLGVLLDSLYLYGSVARAQARPGQSDLDLTLVLSRPLSPPENDALERLRMQLEARHPEVSKIDFDVGVREDVLHPAQANSWGYWLKHECRCIHGVDLGQHFAAFQPSRALALALNGDYVQALGRYASRIAQARHVGEALRWQKEAARKLIRATNVLRPAEDPCWPRTLEEHVTHCVQRHPEMASALAFFLAEARSPQAAREDFVRQLRQFVDWMQRHVLGTPP